MALPATSVWEVRASVGSDNNGGGFDSSKAGTDYSQFNSAQFSGSDLTSVSSLVVSSASHNFVSTDVGNFINISGFTSGFTTGIYEIVSVAANQATLDRSPGTVGIGGVWAEGGALASIGKALASFVSSNIIWIKATASQVLTSAQAMSVGTNGPVNQMIGYTTTRGDGGQATITTSTNSINLFNWTGSPALWLFQNIVFSSTAGTPGPGWFATNQTVGLTAVNCKWTGFSVGIAGNFAASFAFSNLTLINCEVTACTAQGILNSGSTKMKGCYIHANTGDGFQIAESDGNVDVFDFADCIFKSNGGKGINNAHNNQAMFVDRCDVVNNTSDGIALQSNGRAVITNCIIDSNGGWGINAGAALPEMWVEQYNAFGSGATANTSGTINGPAASTTDITLTGDPFVARASNNFALNSTAGAGASCRQAGFPGTLQIGGTGYADIGALRHQDPAAGSPYLGGSAAGMSSIVAM